MKKFLTLAVAVLAVTGMSISATSLSNQNSDNPKEKTEKKKEKKGDRQRVGADGHGQRLYNPFEGLNLTEEQQKKIGSLTPYVTYKAPKSAECCVGDTAACCQGEGQECCQGSTPEQLKQAAKDKLNEIKAILTPEQYQQYLENVAVGTMIHAKQGVRQGDKNKDSKKDKKKVKVKKGKRGEKTVQPQPQTESK